MSLASKVLLVGWLAAAGIAGASGGMKIANYINSDSEIHQELYSEAKANDNLAFGGVLGGLAGLLLGVASAFVFTEDSGNEDCYKGRPCSRDYRIVKIY